MPLFVLELIDAPTGDPDGFAGHSVFYFAGTPYPCCEPTFETARKFTTYADASEFRREYGQPTDVIRELDIPAGTAYFDPSTCKGLK